MSSQSHGCAFALRLYKGPVKPDCLLDSYTQLHCSTDVSQLPTHASCDFSGIASPSNPYSPLVLFLADQHRYCSKAFFRSANVAPLWPLLPRICTSYIECRKCMHWHTVQYAYACRCCSRKGEMSEKVQKGPGEVWLWPINAAKTNLTMPVLMGSKAVCYWLNG